MLISMKCVKLLKKDHIKYLYFLENRVYSSPSVKFVCKRSVEMKKFSVNKQLKFECGNVKFSHS